MIEQFLYKNDVMPLSQMYQVSSTCIVLYVLFKFSLFTVLACVVNGEMQFKYN